MSELNNLHNRVVWFDMPMVDLDRAIGFYERVLAVEVDKQCFNGFEFATLANAQGNGGCLVPNADGVSTSEGNRLALHSSISA
jgi:predicted enzyme related to lactoylglutathione lyase